MTHTFATLTCPALAASISEFRPKLLKYSILAPNFNSSFTVSTWPPADAYINGVFPEKHTNLLNTYIM